MFDEIYNIVKNATNFKELKKKLGRFSIDTFTTEKGIILSIACKLAKEKKDEQVEWCRKLGANVNCIAFGYAMNNDTEKVEIYRKKYGADVNIIAQGYAIMGNITQVNLYLSEKYNNIDINSVVKSYALGGFYEPVDFYCKEHNLLLAPIAFNYAMGGHINCLESFCKKYFTTTPLDINYLAEAYAIGGHTEQIDLYFKKYGANINAIAKGYARGGHTKQVEFYRKEHGANVNDIAEGYAIGGHTEQVEFYLKKRKADVNAIVQGYKKAGNHEELRKFDIIELLNSYLNQRSRVLDSNKRRKEYFYGDFFGVFQKSFTQKEDAVFALIEAVQGKNVNLSEHLSTLRNGSLGKKLRAFVKLGVGTRLLGIEKEVSTVTDFIKALQDKNSSSQLTI